MKEESRGNRKVVLTKWMLSIYTAITTGYLTLMGFQGQVPPDNFLFVFTLGLGGIGGAFSLANVFEHHYEAMKSGVFKNKEAIIKKTTR